MAENTLILTLEAQTAQAVKNIEAVPKALNALPAAANNASKSIDKMSKSAGGSVNVLSNFGRVAQDAAFGPIAIANNLNPLFESFQRLVVETGSAKKAFASLGSSLLSGGGLGLAFSAVTAAISFAEIGLRAWGVTSDDSGKKTKELGDATRYVESQFEKTEKATKALTESLIKQKDAYELLTQNVFEFSDAIAKEAEIKGLLPQVQGFVDQIVAAKIELNKLGRKPVGEDFLFGMTAEEFQAESNRLNNIIKKNVQEIERAKKALEFFAGGKSQLFEIIGESAKKATSSVKELSETIDSAVISKPGAAADDPILTRILTWNAAIARFTASKEKQDLDNFIKMVNGGAMDQVKPGGMNNPMQVFINNLKAGAAEAEKIISDQARRFQEIAQQSLSNTFAAFGQGLGNLMSGMASPFEALFQTLAAAMQQFGEALIGIAIAKMSLDKLFKSPAGGPIALAAGIGLIALSTAVRNWTGPKFAEGGVVNGPTLAMVGDNPGRKEAIIPIEKWDMLNNGGGAVILDTRISGSDLLLVQRRAESQFRRTNG